MEQSEKTENKVTKVVNSDSKTWAALGHASTFSGAIIPFGNIVGPLLIWLIKKEELPFVDEQGKEVLNFQISITIYYIISFVLMLLLIGFLLFAVLFIMDLVLTIIAIVKSSKGEHYRYPLSIRFIK